MSSATVLFPRFPGGSLPKCSGACSVGPLFSLPDPKKHKTSTQKILQHAPYILSKTSATCNANQVQPVACKPAIPAHRRLPPIVRARNLTGACRQRKASPRGQRCLQRQRLQRDVPNGIWQAHAGPTVPTERPATPALTASAARHSSPKPACACCCARAPASPPPL